MKLLNGLLITVLGLILFGVIYFIDQDNQDTVPDGSDTTIVLSLDYDTLKIEQEKRVIYILDGTLQEDVLSNLVATDGSAQEYYIATSEGTKKSQEKLYDYDRLYVVSENGVFEEYYYFDIVNELN